MMELRKFDNSLVNCELCGYQNSERGGNYLGFNFIELAESSTPALRGASRRFML